MNEKFAPELLESKADLVECMLDQIKEMASLLFQFIYTLLITPLHPPHSLLSHPCCRLLPLTLLKRQSHWSHIHSTHP